MFETSPSTEKLDTALARAQAEFTSATKEKTNSAFSRGGDKNSGKYADLDAYFNACRAAMTKHGISVTQWPISPSNDGRAHLVTRLAHSGEWMKATNSIPVTKQDAHGYGSAITYLRKFGLKSALGIADAEDDDGNASVGYQRSQDSISPDKPVPRGTSQAQPSPSTVSPRAVPPAGRSIPQGTPVRPAAPAAAPQKISQDESFDFDGFRG